MMGVIIVSAVFKVRALELKESNKTNVPVARCH
jgi:hypothetical protein